MDDLVSVIITINNDEETLRDCIYSVIGQTYRNIELIVIDDGSTDKSAQICNEMLIANSKLKVFHQVQSGMAVARNKGLEMASGRYVTFINGSDKMSKDLIQDLIMMMNDYDVDVTACKITYNGAFDSDNDVKPITFDNEDVLRQLLIGKTITNTPYAKLFKRELFMNVDFASDDADTLYKIIESSRKIAFMNSKSIIKLSLKNIHLIHF